MSNTPLHVDASFIKSGSIVSDLLLVEGAFAPVNSTSANYAVDTVAPTLSSTIHPTTDLTEGGDGIGDTIALTVTFDGNVEGLTSGTNTTVFEITAAGTGAEATGVEASWSGANGTATRVLTYTVASGQNGQASLNETALKAVLVADITDAAGNAFVYSVNGGVISNIDSTPLPVVDGTPAILTLLVSGDDVISNTDTHTAIGFSGTTNGVSNGAVITVVIGSVSVSATVSNNLFSGTVGLSSATDGETLDVTANVNDAEGDPVSAFTSTVTVDTTPPTVIIDTIPTINASDVGSATISGSAIGAEDQQITVDVNAQTTDAVAGSVGTFSKTVTVDSDGDWATDFDLAATYQYVRVQQGRTNVNQWSQLVEVSILDASGTNVVSGDVSGIKTFENNGGVITQVTNRGVIGRIVNGNTNRSDFITLDGSGSTINIVQFDLGSRLELSSIDVVRYYGRTYENTSISVSVDEKHWIVLDDTPYLETVSGRSVPVPNPSEYDLTVTATVSDSSGNEGSATTDGTVDVNVPNAPEINTVSEDNLINAAENEAGFSLSGTGEDGSIVTVSGFENGVADKTASVGSDGAWAVSIVDGDLLKNGTNTLSVTQADVAGNVSIASTLILTTDSQAPNAATLSSATVSMNTAQADAGVAIFPRISSSYSADISVIKVTIAGASLDNSMASLVLDVARSLGSDFATSSAVAVGGINVTYSYEQSSGVVLIDLADGASFTRSELTTITESLRFMTTSTVDGDRTFALEYEDAAGNASSAATVTITGANLSVAALSTTASFTGISEDTGVSGDFITSDDNGLTISGTISQALSGADEVLELYNGTVWVDISSSLTGTPATSFSYTDTGLTSDKVVKLRIKNTSTNAESPISEQTIVIDTSAPSVDLSSASGVQTTATADVSAEQANSGIVIFGDIQDIDASDITSIEIVIGGAIDTANDQIEMNVDRNINANFSETTGVSIGGVAGVNYSYDFATKALTITKNGGGAFSSSQVNQIQSAVKFKSTSTTEGDRNFTIYYIDVAGNQGASATESLHLDASIPSIDSATVVLSTSVIGYKTVVLPNTYGTFSNVLNRLEESDITEDIPSGMTAASFLSSIVGFRANWGGTGIAGGGNNISGTVTYTTMSDVASNESVGVYLATDYIKYIDIRFKLNGDDLIIRNNATGYDLGQVQYQDLSVTARNIDYGLANINLFYEESISVIDNSPDIEVTYDGADAKVGDKIEIFEGSVLLATHTLTAGDVGVGSKTVTVASHISLAKGVHSLEVRYTDTAENIAILSSGVEFTAGDPAGQDSNMSITGIRSTNAGEAETDVLIGSDNYVSSSAYALTLLGVQDTASFIAVIVGGVLYYAGEVSKGAFDLEINNNWSIAPGIHDVEIRSTNSAGIVNVQTFSLGWFTGSFVTDTITGSDHDDHFMPRGTAATDVITTNNGNDVIYLQTKQRNSLDYRITDFTIGSDTIKANGVVSDLNSANISTYASITYNGDSDAVVTFDSNGLSTAGGDIYTVLLTGVKSATLAQVFSYQDLSSTIVLDNIGADHTISHSERDAYSLSGTVLNPGDISSLAIESIVFTSLEGTQTTVSTNLPTISSTGTWSVEHANMPSLADGRYTVAVNFSGDGGYSKTITNAKPVVVDTTDPTISQAATDGTTVTVTMDEYLNSTSTPDASAFSVSGNTVDAVAIDGQKVVLTVASAIGDGDDDTVTFAYTKPSSGSVLEDTVSNDAVSLNNVFIGTAGANAINGTTSDDFIIGNSAVDTLTGNGGNDIFDYNALSDGNDVITDFTIGDGGDADKLNLKDLLDYSSTDTLANFLQFTHVGTDVTVGISVEGGDTFTADLTLTLSNMGTETLGLSDFVDNNLVVL